MNKLNLVLILNDNSVVCHAVDLHPHESVAHALAAAAVDKDIAPHVDNVKTAIRVLNGEVFVDDRDKALYLMGVIPSAPADAHTLKVTNEVMAHAG